MACCNIHNAALFGHSKDQMILFDAMKHNFLGLQMETSERAAIKPLTVMAQFQAIFERNDQDQATCSGLFSCI